MRSSRPLGERILYFRTGAGQGKLAEVLGRRSASGSEEQSETVRIAGSPTCRNHPRIDPPCVTIRVVEQTALFLRARPRTEI